MKHLRSIFALALIALATVLCVIACAPSQPGKPVATPTPTADTTPAIDYTLQLSIDYRTSRASDTHIRHYGDVTVWSNDEQVVSHVLRSSTRDWNEVETKLSGKTLVVVYHARTDDLLFPHINASSLRDNVQLSIAESTQYRDGVYEYIASVTEY